MLILDDDPDIGEMIKNIAATVGVESQVTRVAGDFFHQLEDWEPTDITIDLMMPDMDGVQVLGQLAHLDCRARIIITSGVGNRVLHAAGRSASEHGLDIAGMLPKPFSPTDLRGLLNSNGTVNLSTQGGHSQSDVIMTAEDLRSALDEKQLFMMFQPKIRCADDKLMGFEALARWRHPEKGMIAPDRFIPLAESYGLIDVLTEQVLDQSLTWFAAAFPGDDLSLAINISATAVAAPCEEAMNVSSKPLNDGCFAAWLLDRCKRFDVKPSRLVIELTETSAMEDPVASLDLLTRLRMQGFQLSIDDFGIGYSSTLQLVRLPFSEIKVDKSFVMSALSSEESRMVIKSIIDLGHGLGLRATAEGVEDAGTLAYLRDIHCDMAQGYHIARPMTGDKVLGWIKTRYQ